MKNVIAIDCDGVLLNTYSHLTNKSEELGINKTPYYVFERDNSTWGMSDVPKDLRCWALQQFKSPSFIESIPLFEDTIPNLCKIIQSMKNPKDFCIVFHTGVSCEATKPARMRAVLGILRELNRLIPKEQLPLFKINVERHKGAFTDKHLDKLGLNEYSNFMIIDDRFKTIQESPALYKILVKQAHNKKDRNKVNFGYYACDVKEIGNTVAKILETL